MRERERGVWIGQELFSDAGKMGWGGGGGVAVGDGVWVGVWNH